LHLEGLGERDHGAVLERSILESALSDCVVALQRLAEQLYQRFPDVSQPRMNAFQRLGDLDRLWLAASGEGLDSWIEDGERSQLNLLYQRRHLLAHTDGVVDSRYLERSGDQVYRVGQRLVVHARDVRRLVELTSRVGAGLRRTAPKR